MAIKFPVKIHRPVPQCKVTFKLDDGSIYLEKSVKKNEVVEKPEDPAKEGYVFKTWQLNGEDFDFETPIVEDIELIAVFLSEDEFWIWDGILTEDDEKIEVPFDEGIGVMALHKVSDETYAPQEFYGKYREYTFVNGQIDKGILNEKNVFSYQGFTVSGASAIVFVSGQGTLEYNIGGIIYSFALNGTYLGFEGYKDDPTRRSYTSLLEKPVKTPIWQKDLTFISEEGMLMAEMDEAFSAFDEINTTDTYTFTCDALGKTYTGQFDVAYEQYRIGNEGFGGLLIKLDNSSYFVTFPEGEAGTYTIKLFKKAATNTNKK